MARRRKYEHITDPITKAAVVIEKFVNEAKTSADTWSDNYKEKIKDYTKNEAKQVFAALKLAGFYLGLSKPEVRNAIRDAINKAKEVQTSVVGAAIEEGKVPYAVPKEIEKDVTETVNKLREITSAEKVATVLAEVVGASPSPRA